MAKRRILIVDDSVVIRRALTAALSAERDFEVVGSAPTGKVALMKIPILQPDIVALDINMAGIDIPEMLKAIRQLDSHVSVLILSEATKQAAAATLDALTLGALDYVTKPQNEANGENNLQAFSTELISKMRACCADPIRVAPLPTVELAQDSENLTVTVSAQRVDVVAIGVSTGGPNALMEVLPQLPADFSVPLLIVQHMPPMFTNLLAERLAAKCKIRVLEAISGQRLLPGCAWIAPGNLHMAVVREGNIVRILTHQDALENSCRPSVDVLFRSLAQAYGSHVLAIVMTGMGKDGLRGCQQIRAQGGQILVQDKKSAIVWGMPSFVVTAGLADRIVPLAELSSEIMDRVQRYRSEESAAANRPSTRESRE